MPCKGLHDNVDEFQDSLAQLQEIIQKFKSSHFILLRGDFNESSTSQKATKRLTSLRKFLADNQLSWLQTGKTYIGSNGVETSTIDYIFYSLSIQDRVCGTRVMDDFAPNVSDHYPILCSFDIQLSAVRSTSETAFPPSKVKWEKIDKDQYRDIVTVGIAKVDQNPTTLGGLDAEIRKLNQILVKASEQSGHTRVAKPRRAKLKTWTPEIKQAIQNKKRAFKEWKLASRPNEAGNILVLNKKLSSSYFRRLCRIESARAREHTRQQILDAKSTDMKTFYRLVNKQRGKLKYCVNELSVNGTVYKSENEILLAWKEHFGLLATPTDHQDFDEEYKQQVASEMLDILDICKSLPAQNPEDYVTEQQVDKALKSMNRGKAADIHGVTVEHLLHGGNSLLQKVTGIINSIFRFGRVTEALSIGTLTPVFKNKGLSTDAKNYRGITILPTITKVVETLLKDRIQPAIEAQQNSLQRGFTKHSSPMNCSLIVEETIREYKDLRRPIYIAFLDAKSAFDVVSHDSLLRKLFHAGVEGVSWSLIHSLHAETESVVKWNGAYSDVFKVDQGVRQGGILSTDLYKLYDNGLFDRLQLTSVGCHIGEISCVVPGCADDAAVLAENKRILQLLVDIAVDYSVMERFLLQPVKSVLLQIFNHLKRCPINDTVVKMKDMPMPIVEEAMHMGILRSADTQETAVAYNMQKARRTVYCLMGSGLHGENSLDPETSIHLLQTYVLPVLVYGMEVILNP